MVNEKKLFGDVYRDKKVLITGHTGFKGSWLSLWLLSFGAKVYGISKDAPSEPSNFEVLGLEKQLTHFQEDIRDLKKITEIVKEVQPDFVFHLAAQALVSRSYENPIETITTNVVGTANILEALRTVNPKCVAVIITSDKCYDNIEQVEGYHENDRLGGKDIYSGSKGAAELIFKSYFHSFFKNNSNVKLATTRAGNVIGGGDWAKDRIVPDCMRAWSENRAVNIRSPKATRPWQHVLEPLSGYLLLGQQLLVDEKLNGSSFNFGPRSEETHSVQEVIESLSSYWNFSDPKEAYNTIEVQKFHEAGLLKLNCDKALAQLDWSPVLDYDTLIKFTGSWYHAFYKEEINMLDYTLDQIKNYEELAANKQLIWSK